MQLNNHSSELCQTLLARNVKIYYYGNITTIRKHIVSYSQHFDSQNAAISEKNNCQLSICSITQDSEGRLILCFSVNHVPNRVGSWQPLYTHIRKVLVSNLHRDTGYSERGFHSPSRQIPKYYYIRPRPLHSPYQFTRNKSFYDSTL
jgi:hypothetical protein